MARREGRRVPQEARAVLRGERRDHGARDLRRAQPDGHRRHLERVSRVSVREALDRRLRLARRVQAAARPAVLRRRRRIDRRLPRAVRQEEAHGSARARSPACPIVESAAVRRDVGPPDGRRPSCPAASLARVSPTYAAKVRDAAQASRRHSATDRDASQARARAGRRGARDGGRALPSHRAARRSTLPSSIADSRPTTATRSSTRSSSSRPQRIRSTRGERGARPAARDSQAEAQARCATSSKRRESQSARFENCVLALENMRYDVLRLKTGGQSFQQVTLLAERAMSLARKSTTRCTSRTRCESSGFATRES